MASKDVQKVGLTRARVSETPDLVLWKVIEDSTRRLSFDNYRLFIDYVLCGEPYPEEEHILGDTDAERLAKNAKRNQAHAVGIDLKQPVSIGNLPDKAQSRPPGNTLRLKRFLPYTDADAYRLLKVATEAFLMVNCGIKPRDYERGERLVPSLENIDDDADPVYERVEANPIPADELDEWWRKYQLDIPDNKGSVRSTRVLPLLSLITKKLQGTSITLPAIPLDLASRPEYIECLAIVQEKLTQPCLLELIWSYWQEEGMLVQTMNAIGQRFQNIRGPAESDPLAMLEIGYLRPLNNLLWGYLQDEQHRLSLVRRAYEYDHHYGLALQGKAVPALRPADSRNKFLEAFHNLLYLCSVLFRQDDDTTVKADGFPVLEAVKDLQLVLTEGQHNQYGDLPSTARIEMLMQQWLLARPEFREVLPTRESVPYPEPWMERVDAMKKLQGWADTSVRHFSTLAQYGERILLSVRYGAWTDIDDGNHAVVWARFFRPAIQSYIYAYQAATGVNLAADAVMPQQRKLIVTQPSELLRQRLPGSSAVPMLPAPASVAEPQGFRARRAVPRS